MKEFLMSRISLKITKLYKISYPSHLRNFNLKSFLKSRKQVGNQIRAIQDISIKLKLMTTLLLLSQMDNFLSLQLTQAKFSHPNLAKIIFKRFSTKLYFIQQRALSLNLMILLVIRSFSKNKENAHSKNLLKLYVLKIFLKMNQKGKNKFKTQKFNFNICLNWNQSKIHQLLRSFQRNLIRIRGLKL